MARGANVAGLVAGILFSSQAALAAGDCKDADKVTASYKRCVAVQNCDFNPVGVCPDSLRDRDGFNQCIVEVQKTFLMCLQNCVNRARMEFGCPPVKLQ
jgi:hypothetical protein